MSMTAVPNSHIVTDETGNAFIAGTRFKVRFIAYAAMDGQTPQQMHEAWPHLTMAQIHSALSYYYDHKESFDAEAKKSLEDAIQAREEAVRTGNVPSFLKPAHNRGASAAS